MGRSPLAAGEPDVAGLAPAAGLALATDGLVAAEEAAAGAALFGAAGTARDDEGAVAADPPQAATSTVRDVSETHKPIRCNVRLAPSLASDSGESTIGRHEPYFD